MARRPFFQLHSAKLILGLVLCLVISLDGYAYKNGEFPGIGSRRTWSQANVSYDLGNKYADQQKYDLAIRKYDEALSLYSHDPRYFFNVGLCLVKRDKSGDIQRAASAFRSATQLDPANWKYWNGLATPLFQLGKYGDARAALLKSLSAGAPQDVVPLIKVSLKEIDDASKKSR
ncbi:MAG: tetratricopeptide repeat protein [Candidatus Obscuribacterales bacterium]|nr:tetratricopeptide repeat protein [Candidatus Obscuribacterales bacterium]